MLLLSATSLLTATQAEVQTVPTDVLTNGNFDPTSFAVTPGNEKLDLTWNPKASSLITYWIQYKRETDTDWTTSTTSLLNQDNSYSITGLTNGILYDVRIFDTAMVGSTLTRGNFVTGSGTPVASALDAPTNLDVTVGNAQLGLTWTAPSGTVTGYDVHYTSASSGTVSNTANASGNDPSTAWVAVTRTEADPPTASQTISSLTNDTPYRVRVRAKDSDNAWVFGAGTPAATQSTDATLSALTASTSTSSGGLSPH